MVYEGAQARVWVARPSEKTVVTRSIEVGATTNGLVEVRKGVSVGDTVVASGTLFIDRAATRDEGLTPCTALCCWLHRSC